MLFKCKLHRFLINYKYQGRKERDATLMEIFLKYQAKQV